MRFALAGLRDVYTSQANFRIEVWAALVALGTAVWSSAPVTPVGLACALVLVTELLNTAVEAVVDLASPEVHPLARVAKDASAAAVLVASVGALIVGGVTLLPAVLARVGLD